MNAAFYLTYQVDTQGPSFRLIVFCILCTDWLYNKYMLAALDTSPKVRNQSETSPKSDSGVKQFAALKAESAHARFC